MANCILQMRFDEDSRSYNYLRTQQDLPVPGPMWSKGTGHIRVPQKQSDGKPLNTFWEKMTIKLKDPQQGQVGLHVGHCKTRRTWKGN